MGFIDEFKKLTHPTDDEDDEDDDMDEAEDLPRSQPVKRRKPFAAFAFGAPAQERVQRGRCWAASVEVSDTSSLSNETADIFHGDPPCVDVFIIL